MPKDFIKNSELKTLKVLGLSHELDLLQMLKNQFWKLYPQSYFDKANNFYNGTQYLASYTYDLVILDMNIIDVYELLIRALAHKFPVLILVDSDKDLNLKEEFILSKAHAVLERRKINEDNLATIIEKIIPLKINSKWKRILRKYKKWFLIAESSIFGRKQKRKNGCVALKRKVTTFFLTFVFSCCALLF